MTEAVSPSRKYVVVAGLGALAGGLFVTFATKAIPRAMSGFMGGMMEQMMARMGGDEHPLPDT